MGEVEEGAVVVGPPPGEVTLTPVRWDEGIPGTMKARREKGGSGGGGRFSWGDGGGGACDTDWVGEPYRDGKA